MTDFKLGRFAWACVLGLGMAWVGGCATDSNVAPSIDGPSFGHIPIGGPRTTSTTPQYEGWTVCKTYVGKVGAPVVIDVGVDRGNDASVDTTFSVTVADGECWLLWIGDATTDNVMVTENVPTDPDGTYDVTWVKQTITGINPTTPLPDASGTGAGPVSEAFSGGPSGVTGVLVTFTNTFVPTPGGGEGCTPGYWKNHTGLKSQTDQWPPTGYAQGDSYDGTFGVTSSFGGTLLEALNRGGGGEIALGRHAVAALLNSTHPDVSYDLSAAGVIAAVQAAYAGGDFEGVKNTLAWYNEQGCPIGN